MNLKAKGKAKVGKDEQLDTVTPTPMLPQAKAGGDKQQLEKVAPTPMPPQDVNLGKLITAAGLSHMSVYEMIKWGKGGPKLFGHPLKEKMVGAIKVYCVPPEHIQGVKEALSKVKKPEGEKRVKSSSTVENEAKNREMDVSARIQMLLRRNDMDDPTRPKDDDHIPEPTVDVTGKIRVTQGTVEVAEPLVEKGTARKQEKVRIRVVDKDTYPETPKEPNWELEGLILSPDEAGEVYYTLHTAERLLNDMGIIIKSSGIGKHYNEGLIKGVVYKRNLLIPASILGKDSGYIYFLKKRDEYSSQEEICTSKHLLRECLVEVISALIEKQGAVSGQEANPKTEADHGRIIVLGEKRYIPKSMMETVLKEYEKGLESHYERVDIKVIDVDVKKSGKETVYNLRGVLLPNDLIATGGKERKFYTGSYAAWAMAAIFSQKTGGDDADRGGVVQEALIREDAEEVSGKKKDGRADGETTKTLNPICTKAAVLVNMLRESEYYGNGRLVRSVDLKKYKKTTILGEEIMNHLLDDARFLASGGTWVDDLREADVDVDRLLRYIDGGTPQKDFESYTSFFGMKAIREARSGSLGDFRESCKKMPKEYEPINESKLRIVSLLREADRSLASDVTRLFNNLEGKRGRYDLAASTVEVMERILEGAEDDKDVRLIQISAIASLANRVRGFHLEMVSRLLDRLKEGTVEDMTIELTKVE
ncbi:MAG: hypothetical protein V1875_03125 [Candidatus Altiarchaeota archaeon]